MDEYVSNSFASKETKQEAPINEKRVNQIVKVGSNSKTKIGFQKLAGMIIQGDVENVKEYILREVIVPSIQKSLSDIVKNGVDMFLYDAPKSVKNDRNITKVSYRTYYDDNRKEERPTRITKSSGYAFSDVILSSRADAEEVLINLQDLIEHYDIARVADFYDLVGVSHDYTDNKYGWTDISTARVVRDPDGYVIELPKPMPIDK